MLIEEHTHTHVWAGTLAKTLPVKAHHPWSKKLAQLACPWDEPRLHSLEVRVGTDTLSLSGFPALLLGVATGQSATFFLTPLGTKAISYLAKAAS